jgi:ketosteroid isomerase-like protein
MPNKLFVCCASLLLLPLSFTFAQEPQSSISPRLSQRQASADRADNQLTDFNRRFIDACRQMDNSAALALWADDGVDLLPGMEPMVGKPAITTWLNGVREQSKGAKMLQCDVQWHDPSISGDLAYEWGINSQIIALPNRPEPFHNKGKITLILRKQADGTWKLVLESWNSSPPA